MLWPKKMKFSFVAGLILITLLVISACTPTAEEEEMAEEEMAEEEMAEEEEMEEEEAAPEEEEMAEEEMAEEEMAEEEMGHLLTYNDYWTWPLDTSALAGLTRGRYYIPVQDESRVVVIDPDADDFAVSYIDTEFVQPHHPWVAPGMRYVFINYQSEGKGDHDAFSVIDTFTNTIQNFSTGINDPFHGSFSPTANILVNSDLDNNAGHIYLWDTMTFELLGAVETTGLRSRDILITHDGKYAFVGHQGYDPDNGVVGAVDIVDLETREVVTSVGEGRCRSGRMSNDGTIAMYSCDRVNAVIAIDTSTFEIIATIEMPENGNPFNISFRPDDKYAYVGLSGNDDQTGRIGIINLETMTLEAALDSGTKTNTTYFHPTAPLAVVTNDGTDSHVTILNTETNEIVEFIETGGKGTHNGAWTPDGRFFLVGNRLGDSVTLLTYNEEAGAIEWYADITVGFGTNGVVWVPYYCGTDFLTDANVGSVENAPATDEAGTCGSLP